MVGCRNLADIETLANRVKSLAVFRHRPRHRRGIFVIVLGLDGAGKSTLIELVRRDIERLTDTETEYRHLRPGLLPSLAKLVGRSGGEIGPVINPHAKPPSGLLLSILRLAYYALDYVSGFWILLRPKLLRNQKVLFFDRYFYDYFVDPARSRVSAPRWIVRFFGWFIPKPDLIIMLTAEPDLLHQRKPELPLSELRQQSARMLKLAKELKNVVWIDTSGEIEASRQEMVRAVLETFGKGLGWQ